MCGGGWGCGGVGGCVCVGGGAAIGRAAGGAGCCGQPGAGAVELLLQSRAAARRAPVGCASWQGLTRTSIIVSLRGLGTGRPESCSEARGGVGVARGGGAAGGTCELLGGAQLACVNAHGQRSGAARDMPGLQEATRNLSLPVEARPTCMASIAGAGASWLRSTRLQRQLALCRASCGAGTGCHGGGEGRGVRLPDERGVLREAARGVANVCCCPSRPAARPRSGGWHPAPTHLQQLPLGFQSFHRFAPLRPQALLAAAAQALRASSGNGRRSRGVAWRTAAAGGWRQKACSAAFTCGILQCHTRCHIRALAKSTTTPSKNSRAAGPGAGSGARRRTCGQPRQVIAFLFLVIMPMASSTFRASYTRRRMFFSSCSCSTRPGGEM